MERRCAITIEVRPFIRRSIASEISASDSESRLEVASSRIRIGASARNARAKRHALTFAAGKLDAAFADQRAVAFRQPPDEIMRVGKPRRPLDRRCTGIRPAIGDVLRKRAVKQDRLLLHDGDLAAQRLLRHVGNVLTIDQDSRPPETSYSRCSELDESGLARTGTADKTDTFAGTDVDRQTRIERREVTAIMERHVLEHDVTACDPDRNCAPATSETPIGSSWIATSSSMSFTERWRLLTCMPTSRRYA